MRRRIVILAHNSNLFLNDELSALSEEYEEVFVLGWGDSGPALDLPPNVTHLGSFHEFAPTRSAQIRRLLSPRFLGGFLRVSATELIGLRLLRHFREFLWFCLEGSYIAELPRMREVLDAPDREVTLYSFWGTGPAFALPWLKKPNGGVIMRLHSADLYEWMTGYLPMRRWLYRHSDLLIFASEHGRRYAAERYPEIVPKSEVRLLGSADHGIGPAPDGGTPLIVTCSALAPVKRVSRLAAALANLAQPIRWVHFGSGPLEDEVRRVAAGAINVESDFRGATPHDEIMRFYQTQPVDVFINVSDREAVAVSISEAMSFGIPIVATAVGGSPEIVGRSLGSGLLIRDDFTDDELLVAIEELIRDGRRSFDPRRVWSERLDAKGNARALARYLASGRWRRGTRTALPSADSG